MSYYCYNNKLVKLEGVADKVNILECDRNKLTSLQDCPLSLTRLSCSNNPIELLWDRVDDLDKLEIFTYMDVSTEDSKEITYQKIDYINKSK